MPPPAAAEPLGAAEFARLIEPLGPFEPGPALAVAVSGGADSTALTLLAAAWAAGRGGRVTGLHVDHGLRPESRTEALLVQARLAAHGITCAIVTLTGLEAGAGLQARARLQRHAALEAACHRRGILHLLLAHHAEDQAETVAMRAARPRTGAGIGLAGIAAIRELTHVRLLRPLLAVPRARLVATLQALGEPWIEDPSNRSGRFERVRLRQQPDFDPAVWHTVAADAAQGRVRLERELARFLADHLTQDVRGRVTLDRAALAAAPPALRFAVLAAALRTIGGSEHPPQGAAVMRLAHRLGTAGPLRATLGGCTLRSGTRDLVVAREPGRAGPPVCVEPGGTALWDGRFEVRNRGRTVLSTGALGRAGRLALPDGTRRSACRDLTAAAVETLPAVIGTDGSTACPTLGWGTEAYPEVAVCPRPRVALTTAPFSRSNVV